MSNKTIQYIPIYRTMDDRIGRWHPCDTIEQAKDWFSERNSRGHKDKWQKVEKVTREVFGLDNIV